MSELLAASLPWLVLVSVALPLLMAALLLVPGARRPIVAAAPFAPLPLLVLVLWVPLDTVITLPWLLIETHLAIDRLGRVFMVFTALLWVLAGVYVRRHVEDPERVWRIHAFHLLAMTGNLGFIIADDLASLYFFFTLMSFSAYGLVIHEGSARARKAARIYIVLTMIAELPLFGGLVLAAAVSDELVLSAVRVAIAASGSATLITALLLVGFGVKAGLLLLHMWMPLAYRSAPAPSSAVLGGAMINTGLLGWIRLSPLGLHALPILGALMMGLGIAAAFYGVAVGVVQRDSKTVLAYSSISQMGLMTMAVGVAMAEPAVASVAVGAAVLFAVHHGLAKGALFLGVGVVRRTLGRRAAIAAAIALVLLVLSISGVPLTSGAIAKKAVEQAVHDAPGRFGDVLPVLLSLSSSATLVLLLRFLACIRAEAGRDPRASVPSLAVPWGLAAVLALASLWVLPWLDAPRYARKAVGLDALWSSAWPAMLGLGLYLGAVALARGTSLRLPVIPEGDLIVPIERALKATALGGARYGRWLREQLSPRRLGWLGARGKAAVLWVVELERHATWTTGAMLLAALVTAFAVLGSDCGQPQPDPPEQQQAQQVGQQIEGIGAPMGRRRLHELLGHGQ